MAESFGLSFDPAGQSDPTKRAQGGTGAGAPPIQQAIQMLSLRLPRVVGANALAPGALLNAPGAMGQAGGDAMSNPLLQALLRLAGLSGGGMAPMQAPMAAPPPRVNPGEEVRRPAPAVQPPPPAAPPPPNSAGPVGAAPGPGGTTFPGAPGGSPFFDRRGPFNRQG